MSSKISSFKQEMLKMTPARTPTLLELESKRVEVKSLRVKDYQDKRDNCMERDCCPNYFVFVLLGLPGANLSYLAANDLSKSSGETVKAKSKDGRHALNVFGKDADLTVEGTNKGEQAELLRVFEKSTQVKSNFLQAAAASDKIRTLETLIAKLEAKPHLAQYPGELVDLEQEHMALLRASLKPTTTVVEIQPFQTPIDTTNATVSVSSTLTDAPSFLGSDVVDNEHWEFDHIDIRDHDQIVTEVMRNNQFLFSPPREEDTIDAGGLCDVAAPIAAITVKCKKLVTRGKVTKQHLHAQAWSLAVGTSKNNSDDDDVESTDSDENTTTITDAASNNTSIDVAPALAAQLAEVSVDAVGVDSTGAEDSHENTTITDAANNNTSIDVAPAVHVQLPGASVEWCRGGEDTIISRTPPKIAKKRPRQAQQEPACANTKSSSGRAVKPKVISEAGQSQSQFCSHLFKLSTRSCPTCFKV